MVVCTHRVVHQGLDAANDGGVDGAVRRVVVHPLQELHQGLQPIQLDEPDNKTANKTIQVTTTSRRKWWGFSPMPDLTHLKCLQWCSLSVNSDL